MTRKTAELILLEMFCRALSPQARSNGESSKRAATTLPDRCSYHLGQSPRWREREESPPPLSRTDDRALSKSQAIANSACSSMCAQLYPNRQGRCSPTLYSRVALPPSAEEVPGAVSTNSVCGIGSRNLIIPCLLVQVLVHPRELSIRGYLGIQLRRPASSSMIWRKEPQMRN